jgi:holliday junction DNA helicase RuvA
LFEYLAGEVVRIGSDRVTLDISGVGYGLKAPGGTLSKLKEGSSARLFISHRIRDDQMVFFGFSQPEERDLFERLCQVSGVGPASALALLSHITPENFKNAILDGDSKVLEKVKGIGKKTAQRIVLDLRGALEKEDLASIVGSPAVAGVPEGPAADAVRALQVLGFPVVEAQDRVRRVVAEQSDSALIAEDLVRLASRRT